MVDSCARLPWSSGSPVVCKTMLLPPNMRDRKQGRKQSLILTATVTVGLSVGQGGMNVF